MSARLLRRTFASPFVVTLAAIPACVVQSGPPARSGPPPGEHRHTGTSEPAQPTPTQGETTVMANPPRPGTESPTPSAPPPEPPPRVISNPPGPRQEEPAKFERHWTVMRQGDKCMAYTAVECPKNATCNPPPPTAYACTPEITDKQPMKIVQWANTTGCHVETPAPPCPPKKMCEPPRPRAVTCPQ